MRTSWDSNLRATNSRLWKGFVKSMDVLTDAQIDDAELSEDHHGRSIQRPTGIYGELDSVMGVFPEMSAEAWHHLRAYSLTQRRHQYGSDARTEAVRGATSR